MNAPVRTPEPGDNAKPLITLDQLKKDYAHVEAYVAELKVEAYEAPPVLEDDDDLAIITGLCAKMPKAVKRIDTLRDEVKGPFREAGDLIQKYFKGLETEVRTLQTALEAIGKRYLDKKREAEAAIRRAEETRLREEADRRAAEAKAAMDAGNLDAATTAHNAAKTAESQADRAAAPVKAADLARTQTVGGTATLEENWTFEIADFNAVVATLGPLGPQFNRNEIEKAIRGFVRKGHRELAGVRIFNDTKFRSRG